MRKRITILATTVLLATAAPPTVGAGVAAGIILGHPTGLSFLFGERVALGAAWSIYNRLHLHGDLWLVTDELVEPVDWFLGMGAKLRIDALDDDADRVSIGARIPVGVRSFVIEQLELFLEIAPGMQMFPETEPDIDAGVGIRYHF